jgi:hypothetical protein
MVDKIFTIILDGNESGALDGNESGALDGSESEALAGNSEALAGTGSGALDGNESGALDGTKSEALAGTKSEALAGTKSEALAGTKSEALAGTKSEALAGTKSETHIEIFINIIVKSTPKTHLVSLILNNAFLKLQQRQSKSGIECLRLLYNRHSTIIDCTISQFLKAILINTRIQN